MRKLNDVDLKLMENLLSLSQDSLRKLVTQYLKKSKYKKVISTKDFVFAEGDIPIALVAHLDTVFSDQRDINLLYDTRKNIMIVPEGAGFDDRAGVYAILQIIESGLRPHVIFTTDEEMGALGADKLAQLKCPFKDLRYIIELDRRGSNDCVFYSCNNQEFTNYIETFGFVWNWGSFSDISVICPEWGTAGVNLSIGYHDEHTTSETLNVGQMLSTIDKVKVMLQAEDIPHFEYIESYSSYQFTAYGYNYGFGHSLDKCGKCKQYYMEEELFPVVMQDRKTTFYCGDCLAEVAWCEVCSSAYEKYSPEAPITGTCPLCQDLKEKKNDRSKTKTTI